MVVTLEKGKPFAVRAQRPKVSCCWLEKSHLICRGSVEPVARSTAQQKVRSVHKAAGRQHVVSEGHPNILLSACISCRRASSHSISVYQTGVLRALSCTRAAGILPLSDKVSCAVVRYKGSVDFNSHMSQRRCFCQCTAPAESNSGAVIALIDASRHVLPTVLSVS